MAQCEHKTNLRVLARQLESILWSLHEQQSRKNVEKELLDPGCHDVRRRWSEVNIQHKDCHYYRAGDEDHSEEEIFADERRCERCGRINLSDEQQEDVERVEDRDAHRYLLSGVRRDVEDKKSDRTDGYTRKYEIDRVEKGFSSDCDVKLDVWIRFWTARIMFVILLGPDRQQIPFRALVIVV